MSLLPSRLDVTPSPEEAEVLDIETEEATATFEALGSETARQILSLLYADPRTPSEIQETIGTSLQNVHYHLDRLEEAGLIKPAGHGYSAKGNEMTVYGPAKKAVVLFAGDSTERSRFEQLLRRVMGLFLGLGASTGIFAALHAYLTQPREQVYLAEDAAVDTTADLHMEVSTAVGPTGLDPVTAFFLGGLVVILLVVLWWMIGPSIRARLARIANFRQ